MSAILAVCGTAFCAMVSDGRMVEEPITDGKIKKGDVLAVAQVAGVMAAKKTCEIMQSSWKSFGTSPKKWAFVFEVLAFPDIRSR